MEEWLPVVVWPGACLIAFVIALGLFRGPIIRFIDRARTASFGGARLDAPTEQRGPSATTITSSASVVATRDQRLPPPDPLYSELEAEARKIVNADANDDAARLEWALRLAAVMAQERNFEAIFRRIFGSQLTLLREINNAGGEAPKKDARSIYDQAIAQFPEFYAGHTFDKWLQWPIDVRLIDNVPGPGAKNAQQAKLRLTRLGHAFLMYSTRMGLPESSKAG